MFRNLFRRKEGRRDAQLRKRWQAAGCPDVRGRVARAKDGPNGPDCEAAMIPMRKLEHAGVHRARNQMCGLMGSSDAQDQEESGFLSRSFGNAKSEAKSFILQASSTGDLVDRCNHVIQEEWVAGKLDLPGNVYRMAAYGKLFFFDAETSQLFDISRICGCCLIWLFQVFGAPTLFLAYAYGMGVSCDKVINWRQGFMTFSDWKVLGTTKLLAVVAIAIFCLNGVFVIMDERRSWEKMDRMFNYLNQRTSTWLRGEGFLFLDAFTNCWVILWCCLATIVVIGPADNPRDVMFDSLGLLFLYNLDDISGDLGFLNHDDWPGQRLAWIDEEMAAVNWPQDTVHAEEDADHPKIGAKRIIVLGYWLTTVVCASFVFILPFISAATSYSVTTVEAGSCTNEWR